MASGHDDKRLARIQRQSRYKKRLSAGKRVFELPLDRDLVDHALIAAGLVRTEDEPDRDQVNELLTAMVAEYLFKVTRSFHADDGLANDRAELIRKLSSDTKA